MDTGDNTNATNKATDTERSERILQAEQTGTGNTQIGSVRNGLPRDRTPTTSSDENVTSVQQYIRPGSSGIESLEPFSMLDVSNPCTSNPRELEDGIVSTIGEAENVIDQTDSATVVPVIESIQTAESAISEAESMVLGETGVAIDEAEKLISKIQKKQLDEAEALLTDAYVYMGQVGIPVPTDEDIAYAEATGNYLGSLGTLQTQHSQQQIPTGQSQQQQPGTNWEGVPCIPEAAGTALDPCSCEPGHHWGGLFIGCNALPGETTVGPQTTLQGGCGPGMMPNPSATIIAGSEGIIRSRRTVQQCDQIIDTSLIQLSPTPSYEIRPGHIAFVPWTTGGLTLTGEVPDKVCIDPCHLPFGTPQPYCVYFPQYMHLCIDPSGLLIASPSCPDGFQEFTNAPGSPGNGGPGNGEPQCIPIPQGEPGQHCRPPEQLSCGPDTDWKNLPGIDSGDDICKAIDDSIAKLENDVVDFTQFIGMASGAEHSSTLADSIINALTGGSEPILSGLLNRFSRWTQTTVKAAAGKAGCDTPAFIAVCIKRAILHFVQKWTDVLPDQLLKATQQQSNTICQINLPTGSEADSGFLANVFTDKEWECYHKAEGNYLDPARKLVDAKRERPNARQIDELYRKKKIDYDEMTRRMREVGVLRDEDRFAIRDLNEHWPSASELPSMMIRDVFDPDAVDRGKLDEDFDIKFQGKIEDYADALGVSRELMKYRWRAHWHLPSYTMAQSFLYRFDDPDLPDNLRFDKEAFRQLLKQDDWAPGYIDRMIETAYHPITRTDAVRSYMIHVIDDDELVKKLKKTGYNDDDAKFQCKYYKKRREIQDKKTSGYPTLRTAVNSYARCEMSETEFNDIVRDISIDDDQTQAAMKAARVSRQVWERKQSIKAIKHPYMIGINDDNQTQQELSDAQVDPSCIADLMYQWERERMRKGKFPAAGQLCEMMERGIIGPETMVLSLVRTGWDEDAAAMIASNCSAKISEKLAERARKEAERQARQLKQMQKEAKAAARLAECGEPPCPANRQKNNPPVAAGQ